MQAFMDSTGALWATGALVGKVGGAFVSTATQHGGQEETIRAFHTELLHHGFVIVGLPYAWQGQMGYQEVTGGTPYGASTVPGGQGERQPSANELEGARFQGRHTAEIASKLAVGRPDSPGGLGLQLQHFEAVLDVSPGSQSPLQKQGFARVVNQVEQVVLGRER